MRRVIPIPFLFVLLLVVPVTAQDKIAINDISHHPFATDFPMGGQLDLNIRPAEIHIVGADKNAIAVKVGGGDGSMATNIDLRLKRSGQFANLEVFGGPHNDVVITIQVPRDSDLTVRVPAGEVDIEGITGNKDVRLRAGELNIAVGDSAAYGFVKASVMSGEIDAPPFRESHGGLFRSFERTGAGKYKLVARLWAGEIVLK